MPGALLLMFMIAFLIMVPIYWWLEKVYKDKKKYVSLLCASLLPLIMFAIYVFLVWLDGDYKSFKTDILLAFLIGSPIIIPDLFILLLSVSKLTNEKSKDDL